MREAVDLAIEMRIQRAEYMMLPPLQPEYDADGELAATVRFDASMMNERSGVPGLSNADLEARHAVVRVVLFPLVVKRGDDAGLGDDKIVVCSVQVLVACDKASRSHLTPSSDAGGALLGAWSRLSVAAEPGAPQSEALYLEGGSSVICIPEKSAFIFMAKRLPRRRMTSCYELMLAYLRCAASLAFCQMVR